MTTQETLDVWFDLDFRRRMRDFCETIPSALRLMTGLRAAARLDWVPPGRSGEWYFDQLDNHLVVQAVHPLVIQDRATMVRDPTCDPTLSIAEIKCIREEAARQEQRPCLWGKASRCIGRACLHFRRADGVCMKRQ